MQKKSSLLAVFLAFGVGTLVDIRQADAQLFPRLRARINERMGQQQPQSGAPDPQYRSNSLQNQPRQNPPQSNLQVQPNRQSALRPATPLVQGDRLPQTPQADASIGVDVVPTSNPTNGLRVARFSEGSLAQRAGLKPGDVIIAIDSVATPSIAAVSDALKQKRPGETVVARVVRGQLAGELTIPLIEKAKQDTTEGRKRAGQPTLAAPPARSTPNAPASAYSLAELGVEVEDSSTARGVEVTKAPANSSGGRAGLKMGDRIVSIDGAIVESSATLEEQLGQRNRQQPAKLQVVRKNRLLVVTLTPENAVAASDPPSKPSSDQETGRSVLEPNSLIKGVGAAFGGLFGGGGDKQAEKQPEKPRDEFALEDEMEQNEKPGEPKSIDHGAFEQIETPEPSAELPRDVPQPRAFE